jgi:hypothetical protein
MSTYRTLGQVVDIRERLVERRQRQRRQADYDLAATAEQVGFWYGSAAGALAGAIATLAIIWVTH